MQLISTIVLDDLQIRDHILRSIYAAWRNGQAPADLDILEFAEIEPIPLDRLSHIVRQMESEGLITIGTMTKVCQNTPRLIACETGGLVDEDLIRKNHERMDELLLALLEHEERTYESLSFSETEFLNQQGISHDLFWNFSDRLKDQGYVEQRGSQPPELTAEGRNAAREVRRRRNRPESFGKIQALPPHPQGIAFQKYVSALLQEEGWEAETSAKNMGEEIDVIFHRATQYYLVECRWKQDPVEANEIRDFMGKLRKRTASVIGCFISMTGFTTGAIEEVRQNLGERLVLCFGPHDTIAWIGGTTDFRTLIARKIKAAYTSREIAIE